MSLRVTYHFLGLSLITKKQLIERLKKDKIKNIERNMIFSMKLIIGVFVG